MLNSGVVPQWLQSLLGEKFFNACIIHEESKKNEKNIFCLDCCEGICPHCLTPHRSHRLLQIRRYVYHDVIRLRDAEKLMDCALVQSYTANSAKVVFLNQRSHTRQCRGSTNICITCDRALQDPFLFCSLHCKLEHVLRTEGGLSKYLHQCEHLTLSEPGSDDGRITPDSVIEPAGSLMTESGSTGSGGTAGLVGCRTLACTATTEVVRKKRSSFSSLKSVCRPVSEITAAMMNRRKCARPQRSPLY